MKKYGAHSKKYLGIALHFHAKWFDQTSHSGGRNTRHPTIRPLRRLETRQNQLLQELREAGRKYHFTGEEVTRQWEHLVAEGTKVATEHFKDNWTTRKGAPIPWVEESHEIADSAGGEGIGKMLSMVSALIRDRSKWLCAGQDMLRLGPVNAGREIFYLRTNRKSRKGKTQFKIGKTTLKNKKWRASAYATNAGPDNTDLLYEVEADHILNESQVRLYLLSIKAERSGESKDWFWLDQLQASLLCDPDRLRAALAAMLSAPA